MTRDRADRVAAFIDLHGLEPAVVQQSGAIVGAFEVVVQIPWIKPRTGETGVDTFIIRNGEQLRQALRYDSV